MSTAALEDTVLDELVSLLVGWRYVRSTRSFRRSDSDHRWSFHIAVVRHPSDIDVIGDVAVEIVEGSRRVCIVGAELGNIAGSGQRRFAVSSPADARPAARALHAFFEAVGVPFLVRYSDAAAILAVLRAGGQPARLLSPIVSLHAEQIAALERHLGQRA